MEDNKCGWSLQQRNIRVHDISCWFVLFHMPTPWCWDKALTLSLLSHSWPISLFYSFFSYYLLLLFTFMFIFIILFFVNFCQDNECCKLQAFVLLKILSWAEGLFDHTLLYGYELLSLFPPQTLNIIFPWKKYLGYDDDEDDDVV